MRRSYPQLVSPSSPVGVVGAGFGGYLAMLLLDAAPAPAPAMCAAVTQPVVDWTRHGGRNMISTNIYNYLQISTHDTDVMEAERFLGPWNQTGSFMNYENAKLTRQLRYDLS